MDQVVGKREFNTVHLLPLVRHVTFESWACPAVMPAITYSENQALRWQLQNLLQTRVPLTPALNTAASPGATDDPKEPIDVVVTINEVNDRHGTGPLVKRIFHGRRHVFSIRSREDWGEQDFGDWSVTVPQGTASRADCFRNILRVLGGKTVRRAFCIPYLRDELISAIAIKECFGAPLCLWIMDDQNVATEVIPDALMRECLQKASLRLATHPELCRAYERKYDLPFYILPAIVPARLVATEPVAPALTGENRGALIGSFWNQVWFDRFCSVLEGSGWRIDWFGNNKSPWFQFPPETLERAGITAYGVVPEERLAAELRKYPFVLVPAGALDAAEKNRGVASLSLPGRILFAAACSHTPVLLVGSEYTCGARFIRHFGIGEVVRYDAVSIRAAIARLTSPEVQRQMRRNAAVIAPSFSDCGVPEWLDASIDLGRPADRRFEDTFAGYNADGAFA
jgi:hypothetical protein